MDRATSAVLARLRRGPASTVELQRDVYATHVAKQVHDLRQAGHVIVTTRLPSGVAEYSWLGLVEPGVPSPSDESDSGGMCRHGYGLRLAQDTPNGPEYDWANCIYCGQPRVMPDVPVGAVQGKPARDTPRAAPTRAPVPQFGDATVVAGSHSYQTRPRPQFGDPALLREMRPKGRR